MTHARAFAQPRIAVVGGSPGGLTVLTLHKRGTLAMLYERATSASLPAAQRALCENGLGQVFKRHARPESDYNSQRVLNIQEIDGFTLRKAQIMLAALPRGFIKWGHALFSVRAIGNVEHELRFANGYTAVNDVLVGAGGAHSLVRPLLSQAQPIYHGSTGAEVSLAPSTAQLLELRDAVANVGTGSLYAVAHRRMLCT